MPNVQLFVGSTTRLYFGNARTLDVHGTATEFTNTAGTLTAAIYSADGGTVIVAATSMTYTAGAATVGSNTYASGVWSLLIPSSTAIVAGTQYQVQIVGTITGNSIPDLTVKDTVLAAYAA